ncbi:phosphoadenylyl-sulfate reductase [bacterium]|nr:phosphoadenylyl-sulfate reductase [bacterium]
MFVGGNTIGSESPDLAELPVDWSPEETLQWAIHRFGRQIAIITSLQKEGTVILDMAVKIEPQVRVITIDTGRLPEETYAFLDEVRERYSVDIEVYFPDLEPVQRLVSRYGMNLFYKNIEARQACCEVRKVQPLHHILAGLQAWVTGLRKQQSTLRFSTEKVEVDLRHGGILKINPLADWSEAQVRSYMLEHDVPRHPLYAQGYLSIGCEPCTRPVRAGEESRAGRWWWEKDARKECGMHCQL